MAFRENSPAQDWIQITIFRLRWTPPPHTHKPQKGTKTRRQRKRDSTIALEGEGRQRQKERVRLPHVQRAVCWPSSKSGGGNRQTHNSAADPTKKKQNNNKTTQRITCCCSCSTKETDIWDARERERDIINYKKQRESAGRTRIPPLVWLPKLLSKLLDK